MAAHSDDERPTTTQMLMMGLMLAPVAGAVLGAPGVGLLLVTLGLLDTVMLIAQSFMH